jgi:phosphoenolpyruvate carboxykinase (ATP)
MLSKKMKDANVTVWLINTGWTGGAYGVGSRMKLIHKSHDHSSTNSELDNVLMKTTKFLNSKTTIMSNVPSEILNPRNTWENPELYDEKH